MKKSNILAIGATVLLLAGCGNRKSSDVSKKAGGKYAAKQELNWTESNTLATADLSKATDTLSFNVLMNTQEGLYRLDKNGTPQLALAKKANVSKDGKTYNFELRKGVKWSNGEDVTAKDFVYSWRRTVDPKTTSQDAFYLNQVENTNEIIANKKDPKELGITANGKYKLTVKLTKAVPYFKQLLAWPLFYPVNQTTVEKYGKLYGTQAKYSVYNGPYVLTGWNGTNKSWTLVKNKRYWDKGNVHLDKIHELVTESTTTGYNLYQAKKADETLLSGQQVKNLKSSPAFVKRLPTATARLDLNQNKVPEFKNKNIRRALSLAIDRKELTDNVLQDGSMPSKGFVPYGIGKDPVSKKNFADQAYVKEAVEFNLKKAKKYLEKGYKETGTSKLDLNILTSDTDTSKQTAEFLQSKLEALPGVKISVTCVPFVQMLAKQKNSDYQITVKTWQSVFADPINFLDIWESDASYNNSGWKNAEFDKLLDEAENTYANQPAKRWQKLVKAEELLAKDQGTIPLYQQAKSQLLRENVKNVVYNPAGVPYDWKTVYIAK